MLPVNSTKSGEQYTIGQSGAVGLLKQNDRFPSSFNPAIDNIFLTISWTCSVKWVESPSPMMA